MLYPQSVLTMYLGLMNNDNNDTPNPFMRMNLMCSLICSAHKSNT